MEPEPHERDLADARRQRRWLIAASAVVVVALAVIAIAIGGAGGDTAGTTTGRPAGRVAVGGLFAGIPQRGVELGSPRAPVTVTEFADLQCPYCGASAREELPRVVARYVRPGRVRLVFRNLAFLGPDSLRGARVVAAAALQNRMWQMVDLVYRNQGEENSGWVTDAYLRRVAAAAGVDVARAFAQRGSVAANAILEEAHSMGKAVDVKSTPTFVIARGGREVKRVTGSGALEGALAEVLNAS
ncbi:MAG: DsbA family protein [Thermoleophilaceae bacterium]